MQNMSDTSYRDLLRNEYFLRKKKNSRYSLRSFSKLLELSPSYVSLLFRGKKNLSQSMATRISDKLKWTAQQKKYFVNLAEVENPQTENSKNLALEAIAKIDRDRVPFDTFELDFFKKIAIWHHNAILMLLTLDLNRPTTQFIKDKLNLTHEEAKTALSRLERLGLVTLQGSIWKTTTTHLKVLSTPSEAIRNYHKQMLSLAESALEKQTFAERDFSNVTFTVDASKIEAAKSKILDFRKELTQFLEGEKPTEVYQLSIQLFKLTHSGDNL